MKLQLVETVLFRAKFHNGVHYIKLLTPKTEEIITDSFKNICIFNILQTQCCYNLLIFFILYY